eukprot:TRINITY_DN2060_c0_g1_i3.p1 TRINITY_DN2060_c0_g1~~TRINITY_DN2060_c0_g1_i3.p1  ORF type:complete len:1511 (+),score=398.40 TRINITY_DN2060_c0_g1_i3:550-4533(+)
MAADSSGNKLYLMSGKRKVEVDGNEEKTEYEDFWSVDVGTVTWEELASASKGRRGNALADANAPPIESMDGSMAVTGGVVFVAGSDGGEVAKSFRYSISSGAWLAPIEDSRLAIAKPVLVGLPSGVALLLAGIDAAESPTNAGGLRIDLTAAAPAWEDAGLTGDAPSGEGFAGGSDTDGGVVLIWASLPDATNAVHKLDVAAGTWTKAAASGPAGRVDAGAVVVQNTLVVFGGENSISEELVGDVWAHFPYGGGSGPAWLSSADQWTTLVANPTGDGGKEGRFTVEGCSATIGTKVYSFGGVDDQNSKAGSATLRVLDLESRSWTSHSPAAGATWPGARYNCKMAADSSGNKLYLMSGKRKVEVDGNEEKTEYDEGFAGGAAGGENAMLWGPDGATANAVYSLDMASKTWTKTTASGPVARVDAGAAVVDGIVVVFGGEGAVSEELIGDVWAFNPSGTASSGGGGTGGPPTAAQVTNETIQAEHQTFFASWAAYEQSHTTAWTRILSNRAVRRSQHQMRRVGSKVYIWGGEDTTVGSNKFGLDTMVIFDFDTLGFVSVPRSDPWPPSSRSAYLESDERRGVLYLFGGKNSALTLTELTQLWEFNTQTWTWRRLYMPSFVSSADDPCAQGSLVDANAPVAIQASDASFVSTRDYIIVAGSDKGEHPTAKAWDKNAEAWITPINEPRVTPYEDPGTVSLGGTDCCGIWTTGQTAQGGLGSYVAMVNTTTDPWTWTDLAAAEDAIQGEDYKFAPVSGGYMVLGDVGGQGLLADSGRFARFHVDWGNYTIVNQSSGCDDGVDCVKADQWWLPSRTEFQVVSYRDKLVVFGGVIEVNGSTDFSGDIWVYDNSICPRGCSGLGECFFGNCRNCQGAWGVGCEIPFAESASIPWEGIGPAIGVVVVIIGVMAWVLDAENRKKRRMYNINKIAEESADAIASLHLDDHLEHLRDIQNPTRMQKAFISIIETMKMWRSYIPQSVLQAVADSDSDDEKQEVAASEVDTQRSKYETPMAYRARKDLERNQSSAGSAGTARSERSGAASQSTRGALQRRVKEAVSLGLSRKRVGMGVMRMEGLKGLVDSKRFRDVEKTYCHTLEWVSQKCKKAAVTCCVGDEAFVTWGAFGVCADIPGKMLGLAHDCAHRVDPLGGDGVALHFAASLGNAAAGYVGSETARFSQALGQPSLLLRPLIDICRECGATAVTDAKVQADGAGKAIFRPIALFVPYGCPSARLQTAYQVMGQADQDDEWMYNLEKAEGGEKERTWKAMWAVFEAKSDIANFEEAIPLLTKIAEAEDDAVAKKMLRVWLNKGCESDRNWSRLERAPTAPSTTLT